MDLKEHLIDVERSLRLATIKIRSNPVEAERYLQSSLMAVSNINEVIQGDGKNDDLKIGNCNLADVSKRFLVAYRYTNRTDATVYEDEIIAENCVDACNKVCENHNYEVIWHTVKEKTDC